MRKTEQSKGGWYFLGIVVIIYIILSFINIDFLIQSLKIFIRIILRILPVLFIAFLLMFFINYFVTPKILTKHLTKKNKIKKWIIAITAGIISTGPIYMWYPMLSDLKDKGVNKGLIATFLYSRAVKPALIPMMILYFGLSYTIIFTLFIILFSFIQGIIINKLEVKK